MAIVWLSTPVFIAIGSFGAGLALHAMSKLWAGQQECEGDVSERATSIAFE